QRLGSRGRPHAGRGARELPAGRRIGASSGRPGVVHGRASPDRTLIGGAPREARAGGQVSSGLRRLIYSAASRHDPRGTRKGGRVVECAGLEIRFTVTP